MRIRGRQQSATSWLIPGFNSGPGSCSSVAQNPGGPGPDSSLSALNTLTFGGQRGLRAPSSRFSVSVPPLSGCRDVGMSGCRLLFVAI